MSTLALYDNWRPFSPPTWEPKSDATILMSRHMDFIGQRADKVRVEVVGHLENVGIEPDNRIVKGDIVLEVTHYTITCPDCDGVGYYDQRGDVVCEDCGMVLTPESPATLFTEFGEESDAAGSSRGVEKMESRFDGWFGHEPG